MTSNPPKNKKKYEFYHSIFPFNHRNDAYNNMIETLIHNDFDQTQHLDEDYRNRYLSRLDKRLYKAIIPKSEIQDGEEEMPQPKKSNKKSAKQI